MERRVHTAEHLASAMFWLGVPQREIPRAKLVRRICRRNRGTYAVIHPFASSPDKTWPAERFVGSRQAIVGTRTGVPGRAGRRHRAVRGVSRLEECAARPREEPDLGRCSCSSATTADRRTSRRRSACPWWCCSEHPIRSRGRRGGPNRRCSRRAMASTAISRRRRARRDRGAQGAGMRGTGAAAALFAAVRSASVGVGCVDGVRRRGAGADGAADRADFRPRAESRIGRCAGAAVHDSDFEPPGLSAAT